MAMNDDFLSDAEEIAHLTSPLALASRVQPNFRPRLHQKVISDAIVDAVAGRGPRFIAVSVPQQFGKSFVTSLMAPAWWMELHAYGVVPGGLCALVSNEDSLAMKWSVDCRRMIAARPDVFQMQLRRDSKAAGFWETMEGGGILAIGIGGSIVGRPVSLLIIDDPTKNFEQATSEKHQATVWDLWQTVGIGRLQPWTVVLVVMTRWAALDFIGRLLSPDINPAHAEWRYIRIPAICDSENDPIGREIGEALIRPQAEQSPQEALLEMEQVKARISTYTWSTMWQQNPVDPEGTIFFESRWRYWGGDSEFPLPPSFDQVIMSWDMAFKGESEHDWVVGQAWGGVGADRYLIDQVRGHWGFTETVARVKSFAEGVRRRYPRATAILVEDKANGPAVIDALRSRVGGLVAITPEGSKESRAWACQPLLLGGNLYAPARSEFPWVGDALRELADFPRGAHDDVVDATTQALLFMQTYQPHTSVLYSGSPENISTSSLTAASTREHALWVPRQGLRTS